jgi:hypothetical protein
LRPGRFTAIPFSPKQNKIDQLLFDMGRLTLN